MLTALKIHAKASPVYNEQLLEQRLEQVLVLTQPEHAKAYLKLFKASGVDRLIAIEIKAQGPDDPLSVYRAMNQILQKHWLRKPENERWDIDTTEYMKNYNHSLEDAYAKAGVALNKKMSFASIEEALKNTQIYAAQLPVSMTQHYDAALILGSLHHDYKLRFEYLIELLKKRQVQTDAIYMLSGKRALVDNLETDVMASMKACGIVELNEATMTQFLTKEKQKQESVLANIPIYFVESEQKVIEGKVKRATTEDTLKDFVKGYTGGHHYLVLSQAPFISYQGAISSHYLGANNVTMAGDRADKLVAVYADKMKDIEVLKTVLALDAIARTVYQTKLTLELEKQPAFELKSFKP